MRMKKFLVSCLVIGGGAALHAQTPTPAPSPTCPPPPLLKPIPVPCQWTIVRKTAAGNPAEKKDPAKPEFTSTVVGQKAGDILHLVQSQANGNKMETWRKGVAQVVTNTGWKEPAVTLAAGAEQNFQELSWVSPANFQDIRKVPGHGDCMYFKDKILPAGIANLSAADIAYAKQDGTDIEAMRISATAWIEVESRLPVAIQVGDEVVTYKFEPLSTDQPLTLPEAIQTALSNKQQQLQQATSRKPLRP